MEPPGLVKRLALLATLAVAACTTTPTVATTTAGASTITSVSTTATTVRPTTTTTRATTTTTVPPTTTSTTAPARHVAFTSTLSLDVYGSTGPTVVLFHGGGWIAGTPDDIAPLARTIAESGAVVFNAPYRLMLDGGGFPMTFEDAACAVRFAAAQSVEYGGDPSQLVVVGYSAGAQIAALVALAADTFDGDCLVEMNDTLPTTLVGLAGPYDTDALGPLMIPFFGTDPEVDPEPWRLGNPLTYIGDNPDLVVRLFHGQEDLVVPPQFSEYFEQQLEDAGYDSRLTILPGVNHHTIADPAVSGTLLVDAIES
jgi:acetyl esterase/lipase